MDRSAAELIELGRALMKRQAWEEAHATFTEAVQIDPSSEAFALRGWCCSYLGELDEAIAACRFDRMLDLERFTPPRPAVRRALSWVREHVSPTGGILVHSLHCQGYPEVTGYFVPTLLEYGEHRLADELIEWLLRVQNADGSFPAPNGRSYVFDAGQVLRGLNASVKTMPETGRIVDAIRRAADFMLSQALEDGSSGFRAQYKTTDPDIPESILLYAVGPLREAGLLTGEAKYIDVAQKCFSFYCAQPYAFDPATLTHYLGYEIEAAIDWNRSDLVKSVLERLAEEMTPAGAVRGKPGVDWVCVPGSAQIALCWYKLGQWRHGDRAMAWLDHHQRSSGAWPGSIGSGASYAADVEPSWAVKYYLDAHRLRVAGFMGRNADRVSPIEVQERDGQWDAILDTVGSGRVLEVGCGRGRWLKLLKDLRPDAILAGLDPSPELLSAVPNGIECKVGSVEAIPYADCTFESVFIVDALAHSSNLERSVAELARVTRPGGAILIIDKDRRHQGRIVCPPWEQWIDSQELTRVLSEVCDDIEEEKITCAGRPADGLMVAWRARTKSSPESGNRILTARTQISPQPLGWLAEGTATTQGGSWSIGPLSQNVTTYQLTAVGIANAGTETARIDIGSFAATTQPSESGEIRLSLRVPAAVFSGPVPAHVEGANFSRLVIVPTGVEDLALRAPTHGKYEAIMTMPLARRLIECQLFREAAELLECVIALHPNIGEAHYLLGHSLTTLHERADVALAAYDQALALNFSEFWIVYNRGILYFLLNEKDKASRDFNRAAELDPTHEGVRLYREQLTGRAVCESIEEGG